MSQAPRVPASIRRSLAWLVLVAGIGAVQAPAQVFFHERFQNNANGWTMGSQWQIGAAQSSTGQTSGNADPAIDADNLPGGGVAGVVLGGNATTAIHGYYWLTSPVLPVPYAFARLKLRYARHLNSDYMPYMTNRVEVFDGQSWIVVWQSGASPAISDASWRTVEHDISTLANASLRVRFGVSVGATGAFTVSSWNIDDVMIVATDFHETFDDNSAGWSGDPEWEIGPATLSTGQSAGNPDPAFDGDGVLGGGVAGVVIGGNADTTPHGYYFLTSPVINTTGMAHPTLTYDRHLNTDYYPYMHDIVEVFDGYGWTTIWAANAGPPAISDASWIGMSHDLTPFSNPYLQIRFGFGVGQVGAYDVSSWNLDNVHVGEVAPLNLAFSAPQGPGSIRVSIDGNFPNAPIFTPMTVHRGAFPNGWLYGLDAPLYDLVPQFSYGQPPFLWLTDAAGHAEQTWLGTGIPPAIEIYGIALVLGPYLTPTAVSAPTVFTTL